MLSNALESLQNQVAIKIKAQGLPNRVELRKTENPHMLGNQQLQFHYAMGCIKITREVKKYFEVGDNKNTPNQNSTF